MLEKDSEPAIAIERDLGRASPHVAAVVLNWNGREETLACLASLAESDWPRLTPIVVDNASEEDVRDAVLSSFADAIVVRNSTNLGFAGGMNVGLNKALELGADYVLLLNNDTTVDAEMVRQLVEAAERLPDAGIVNPLMLYRDRPDLIASAGLNFDARRGHHGPPIAMGEPLREHSSEVVEVDASPGTAMLVSADVVREVGMLDEELYLYVEDVDWSLRMRSAGRRIYVVPSARLWHGVSGSSGGEHSALNAYYVTRNKFVVCARHAPLGRVRGAVRHAEILVANLIHARRGRNPRANARAVLAGWRDYLRGVNGPRRDG